MTDRPRADVEEMVRRLRTSEKYESNPLAQKRYGDAATLLSQEHARAERAEAERDAVVAANSTMSSMVTDMAIERDTAREKWTEYEEKWWAADERADKAEARAEQLERQLAEANAIVKAALNWSYGEPSTSVLMRAVDEYRVAQKERDRHASRASKQKE